MAGQPKTRAKRALKAIEDPQNSENPEAGIPPVTDDGASVGDRPPRTSRTTTKGRRPSPTASGAGAASDRRPPNIRKIQDGLTQTFILGGLGVSMFDPFDGQVIALNAETLARAWADLAQQSPIVRKYLEKLLQGGAWGAAIGSTAMVCVPILVRHGMAPFDLAVMAAGNGVKIPDVGYDEPAQAPAGEDFPPVPETPQDEAEAIARERPAPHPFGSAGGGVDPDTLPAEGVVFPVDASSGMNGAA